VVSTAPLHEVLGLTPDEWRKALRGTEHWVDPVDDYIKQIKENGYVLIKGLIPNHAKLLETVKSIDYKIPEGNTPYLNQGHDVIYSLQDKDPIFTETILRNEVIKEILAHFLNDEWYKNVNPNYIMRAMIARSSGEGTLPLHLDSFIPSSGKYCWSMQISMVLEDQNEMNGCTILAPGTHLSDEYAKQNQRTIPVVAEAGDVIIFDSRIHHGAAGNKTLGTRWAIITTFTRWFIKQHFSLPKTFSFKSNFTKEELAIIGYCCQTPLNESERMDIKGGYDLI